MSNVPNLQTLVDWANIGIVIALAASFVFGGASIFFSRRLSRQREDLAAREKQISDEKIEAAKADAARANTEAVRIESEGKERVANVEAEAREKIAELTAEAEQARANIATAKADAAKANEGAVKATAEVARLQIVVANAERERAEAQRALLELQERLRQRVITNEQTPQLLEVLSARPKGRADMEYPAGDTEAQTFALQVREILITAGWEVDGPVAGVFEGTPKGIIIVVGDAHNPPAAALQEAFRHAGIDANGELQKGLEAGKIRLIVGHKP